MTEAITTICCTGIVCATVVVVVGMGLAFAAFLRVLEAAVDMALIEGGEEDPADWWKRGREN